ncbi:glycosyltransferase 87 family protein [Psychromicrobium sp. YIM B11713]|uniref:glycosyltransferase 87 family protein n=1 Tax=Psychromicrobium sp. YIM B11713 TaxID=3145233 RepID=UPI00374F33F4
MTLRSPLAQSIVTLLALVVAALLVYWAFWMAPIFGLDFGVYISGGQSVLDGAGELYTKVYNDLLFTYSPFSALFFSILALFGLSAGLTIFTTLSMLIAGLTALYSVRFVFQTKNVGAVLLHPWLRPLTIVAAGFIVALGPWRETTAFGQINILLLGMIMADYLIKSKRWPTGVLVGIAAGIKLTPLVLGLYFLCTGNWRALRNMALGFLGTVLLGFLLMPKESVAYWFHLLPDTSRIGGAGYVDNLSIKGAILHFMGPDFAVNLPWLALSLVLTVLTGWAVWSAKRQGQLTTGLAMTVLLMLLISPITWSHHWVWIAVIMAVLAFNLRVMPKGRKGLRAVGYALLILAVPIFLYSPKTIGTALGATDLGSQIPTVWLMASSVGVFWGIATLIWWFVVFWENPKTAIQQGTLSVQGFFKAVSGGSPESATGQSAHGAAVRRLTSKILGSRLILIGLFAALASLMLITSKGNSQWGIDLGWILNLVGFAGLLLALLGGILYFRARRAEKREERPTVREDRQG